VISPGLCEFMDFERIYGTNISWRKLKKLNLWTTLRLEAIDLNSIPVGMVTEEPRVVVRIGKMIDPGDLTRHRCIVYPNIDATRFDTQPIRTDQLESTEDGNETDPNETETGFQSPPRVRMESTSSFNSEPSTPTTLTGHDSPSWLAPTSPSTIEDSDSDQSDAGHRTPSGDLDQDVEDARIDREPGTP
jgi:hypothetical protein